MSKKYLGPTLAEFLKEQGIQKEVEEATIKELIASSLAKLLSERNEFRDQAAKLKAQIEELKTRVKQLETKRDSKAKWCRWDPSRWDPSQGKE